MGRQEDEKREYKRFFNFNNEMSGELVELCKKAIADEDAKELDRLIEICDRLHREIETDGYTGKCPRSFCCNSRKSGFSSLPPLFGVSFAFRAVAPPP